MCGAGKEILGTRVSHHRRGNHFFLAALLGAAFFLPPFLAAFLGAAFLALLGAAFLAHFLGAALALRAIQVNRSELDLVYRKILVCDPRSIAAPIVGTKPPPRAVIVMKADDQARCPSP